MKLTVTGGLYVEKCVQPLWDAVFGSGGRAAVAVSSLVPETVLAAYVPDVLAGDAQALADRFDFKLQAEPASYPVTFDYLHPLSTPHITPSLDHMVAHPPIQIKGELILRFGMLEGDAIIDANTAVYDPQSAFGAKSFRSNGSTANRLAYVLPPAKGVGAPAGEVKVLEVGALAVKFLISARKSGAAPLTAPKQLCLPL